MDLYNKETLPTMLSGSSLMVTKMTNGMPMIDGMMSNSTVMTADMMADMVRRLPCMRHAACMRCTPCVARQSAHCTDGRNRRRARNSTYLETQVLLATALASCFLA